MPIKYTVIELGILKVAFSLDKAILSMVTCIDI